MRNNINDKYSQLYKIGLEHEEVENYYQMYWDNCFKVTGRDENADIIIFCWNKKRKSYIIYN